MSDNNRKVTELQAQRDQYAAYIKHLDREIEELKKVIDSTPDISGLIGRYFIDKNYDFIYTVIAPAMSSDGKTVTPGQVFIEHYTVNEGDEEFGFYTGEHNFSLDFLEDDIEISKEAFDQVVKQWSDLTKKVDERRKVWVAEYKNDMRMAAFNALPKG